MTDGMFSDVVRIVNAPDGVIERESEINPWSAVQFYNSYKSYNSACGHRLFIESKLLCLTPKGLNPLFKMFDKLIAVIAHYTHHM